MCEKQQLMNQVVKVIDELERNYANAITGGYFQTLYSKYKKALFILESGGDIAYIRISGGARAYHDSYNDGGGVFVEDVYKAELLLKSLNSCKR